MTAPVEKNPGYEKAAKMTLRAGRLVTVTRDSFPGKYDSQPKTIAVDSYGLQPIRKVSAKPITDGPMWQQFLVDTGPDGDKLIEALKEGPVLVRISRDPDHNKPTTAGKSIDSWVVAVDGIRRP